jgi:hypothetical protein
MFDDAAEEELQPIPFASFPYRLQQPIIGLAVLLKEQAQIQQWLAQDAALA